MFEDKGVKPYLMDSHVNLVATTNNRHPVKFEKGDRRWAAIKCAKGDHIQVRSPLSPPIPCIMCGICVHAVCLCLRRYKLMTILWLPEPGLFCTSACMLQEAGYSAGTLPGLQKKGHLPHHLFLEMQTDHSILQAMHQGVFIPPHTIPFKVGIGDSREWQAARDCCCIRDV